MSNGIPIMLVEWPWDPGHAYRLYVIGTEEKCRRLFRIWFSKNDQSLYLMPLYNRKFTVQTLGSEEPKAYTHCPGKDFHLSLHERGVVRLTTSNEKPILRHVVYEGGDVRHLATFQINTVESLPETSLDEFNKPKRNQLNVPIPALPVAPVMITTYCVKETTDWSPPVLGNAFMLHYKTKMIGKDHNFHFVVWQELAMTKGAGDIALQLGQEGDAYCGL